MTEQEIRIGLDQYIKAINNAWELMQEYHFGSKSVFEVAMMKQFNLFEDERTSKETIKREGESIA